MSKTITHEGKEYILKSEVDNIVSNRISKISESRRGLQSQLDEMTEKYSDMEERTKSVDSLQSQIEILQDELSNSNKKYSRHTAISNHGITNPEVRDLVEWQYTKAMESKPKKERPTMGEWLQSLNSEGAQIPHVLQPYLGKKEVADIPGESSTPAQIASLQQSQPQSRPIPSSNNNVQQVSNHQTSADMLSKGGTDYDYFRKNRAKIKELYYSRKGKNI